MDTSDLTWDDNVCATVCRMTVRGTPRETATVELFCSLCVKFAEKLRENEYKYSNREPNVPAHAVAMVMKWHSAAKFWSTLYKILTSKFNAV
jgi:hypothetical protein